MSRHLHVLENRHQAHLPEVFEPRSTESKEWTTLCIHQIPVTESVQQNTVRSTQIVASLMTAPCRNGQGRENNPPSPPLTVGKNICFQRTATLVILQYVKLHHMMRSSFHRQHYLLGLCLVQVTAHAKNSQQMLRFHLRVSLHQILIDSHNSQSKKVRQNMSHAKQKRYYRVFWTVFFFFVCVCACACACAWKVKTSM